MTSKSLSGPAAIAALPRNRLLGEFSLWSADLANMERDLRRIEAYADLHHIDVADARFTPGFLFFPDLVARIARLTAKPIHVHLMVEAEIVEAQTRQFIEAGADLVTIHAENGEAGLRAVKLAHELGAEAGVVLRLETPVSAIVPFLPEVAFVEMGIFKRQYRDHRLEWMMRSGGLPIVLQGIEKNTIRFGNEIA